MELTTLRAISPIDGRYGARANPLREFASEYALIRYRVLVEVRWLQFLADEPSLPEIGPLQPVVKDVLNEVADNFSGDEAARVKAIEATTNHDVKAVEYFLRERIGDVGDGARIREFIHFACTSEDINNLAYALMLRHARDDVIVPAMRSMDATLAAMSHRFADLPMLSRTHGQTASPTTVGKEIANIAMRLSGQRAQFRAIEILGKLNGAVGNFNAHAIAYPDVDWQSLSTRFVESLGLKQNPMTTQIEPHDWIAEYCHCLSRYNTVLIDFCRDIWGYISLGYFRQRSVEGEVGSSTMPHKVNPIDFENAEGNLGLANALLTFFAGDLPVSRWQRDLTDSTVLRNIGVALAHSFIAYDSAAKGLGKLQPNSERLREDLEQSWEVLAEAVQTVMRRHGLPDPYEQLKQFTRGQKIDRDSMRAFIRKLDLPDADKKRLLELTPGTYTGLATRLVEESAGKRL